MTFLTNGEEQEVAATTLADLLLALDYEGGWRATAGNGELVHREDRADLKLGERDRIVILRLAFS
ncbi:sulfur carrier protein ThiS, partial [Rhizobium johnstonii]|uniref:sulfur carrier protein ThiS n=1 Tax=Rhizobium johnstonii TaxID=3019933 RepID=UPI003F978DFA